MSWQKVAAQVIIQGTSVFARAFAQAYQQALSNARKGGGAAAAGAAKAASQSGMATAEAMQIMNFEPVAGKAGAEALGFTAAELSERYQKYFKANDPKDGGSLYLQSKVYRANETLEAELAALDAELDQEIKESYQESGEAKFEEEEKNEKRK